MRIRTVKPEFWQDEEISELPAETALLAIGLLNYADDEGYFKFHPKLIESSVFPLRELSRSIHGMLTELSSMGYITLHEASDGKKYGRIVNFLKHQRVNKPSASKIVPILVGTIESDDSRNSHGIGTEDSPTERNREQGKEQGTGKGVSCPISSDAVTPTADDSKTPLDFNQPSTKAQKAENIYQAYPRKVGKKTALKAIEKALKEKKFNDLLTITESYATARIGQDEQFTPHPATWFNQGRYDDDPKTWPDPNSGGSHGRPNGVGPTGETNRDRSYGKRPNQGAPRTNGEDEAPPF